MNPWGLAQSQAHYIHHIIRNLIPCIGLHSNRNWVKLRFSVFYSFLTFFQHLLLLLQNSFFFSKMILIYSTDIWKVRKHFSLEFVIMIKGLHRRTVKYIMLPPCIYWEHRDTGSLLSVINDCQRMAYVL